MRTLLAADERDAFDEAAARSAFIAVFDQIVRVIPGAAWARTDEMRERFGL